MRRLLVPLVLCLLVLARPALAHVGVSPDTAERGSTTTFTFSVPNEEAPAKTTKVEVFFPEGTAFETVTPGETAGWTATPSPTSVAWSGGAIAGEDKASFGVTLGPVPRAGEEMVFKVLQTYDNGEVARWIDIQTGSEEPPHPAPVVKLTGAAPTTTEVAATTPPTTATPKASGDDDDDDASLLPVILVLIATFFAAVGVGIGVGIWRRSR